MLLLGRVASAIAQHDGLIASLQNERRHGSIFADFTSTG